MVLLRFFAFTSLTLRFSMSVRVGPFFFMLCAIFFLRGTVDKLTHGHAEIMSGLCPNDVMIDNSDSYNCINHQLFCIFLAHHTVRAAKKTRFLTSPFIKDSLQVKFIPFFWFFVFACDICACIQDMCVCKDAGLLFANPYIHIATMLHARPKLVRRKITYLVVLWRDAAGRAYKIVSCRLLCRSVRREWEEKKPQQISKMVRNEMPAFGINEKSSSSIDHNILLA